MKASRATSLKKLIRIFDDKLWVAGALFGLLVILLAIYLPWAMNRQPEAVNWDRVIRPQPGAFLEIDVDLPELAKRYRSDSTATLTQQARLYLESVRGPALGERLSTFSAISTSACKVALTGLALPPVLAALAQDSEIYTKVDGGNRALKVRCSDIILKPGQSADVLIRSASTEEILSWIDEAIAKNLTGCPACGPSLGTELDIAKSSLLDLIEVERAYLERARGYLKSLSNGLNFGFLYSERYEWLIHLAVLSWIGVITAAFAQLVVNIAERRPTGLSFTLTLFRFVTAPIIAVVFVATITYGLTDDDIALHHRPMFLIFAFATGYLSESFNLMLREGLNRLIPSFGINAARVAAASDLKAAAKQILNRPKISGAGEEITTLRALDQRLKAAVSDSVAEVEAEVVDKLTY